jgi:hypothetical protein
MAQPETREMYGEIATLIGSLAKALGITDAEVIAGVERGEVVMQFGRDENGNRFVAATHRGQTARVYQGAIRHPEPPDTR